MKNNLQSSNSRDIRCISSIIETAEVCMFTTYSESDGIYSRPMQTLQFDENGCLWFFVSSHSRLISEIRANNHVHLNYAAGKSGYVSASGLAHEIFNRTLMKKLWTPAMNSWFDHGLDSEEILLIRVEPQNIEYWETPTSVAKKIENFNNFKQHAESELHI